MNYNKLRKLAMKSSGGPWFSTITPHIDEWGCEEYDVGPIENIENNNEQYEDTICRVYGENHDGKANSEFIAACDPNTILFLLDTIDKLKKQLKRVKK